MSKIAILTDSASDIPKEYEKEYGIDILNFSLTFEGESYTDREDFTIEEYYEKLRNTDTVPTTSQITRFMFCDKYSEYEKNGYTDVIYISICGKGSATLSAATLAIDDFREENPDSKLKVHTVDSRTYSMVYGAHVVEAARKIRNGAGVKVVIEYLEEAFSRMEVVLAAYNLKFLKKSGRVSAAAAFAGELLGLKPIITLIDGVSTVVSKVRGDNAVVPSMLKVVKENMPEGNYYMIGTTDQKRAKEAAKLATKELGYAPAYIFNLGCMVSTNTGPDAIAFVYEGVKRA